MEIPKVKRYYPFPDGNCRPVQPGEEEGGEVFPKRSIRFFPNRPSERPRRPLRGIY